MSGTRYARLAPGADRARGHLSNKRSGRPVRRPTGKKWSRDCRQLTAGASIGSDTFLPVTLVHPGLRPDTGRFPGYRRRLRDSDDVLVHAPVPWAVVTDAQGD